jgi:hypothetical protein
MTIRHGPLLFVTDLVNIKCCGNGQVAQACCPNEAPIGREMTSMRSGGEGFEGAGYCMTVK